ncbi:MAG: nuclear transport factor 2 family protein [Chitinophagales bacterium]|nr:nuclear transport factor 2 family protein [Chitinophagales bacterium]
MNLNIELTRKLYKFFAVADYKSINELFDTDIVWEQMTGFPGGGTYKGTEQIISKVFSSLKNEWSGWKTVVSAMAGDGDFVFVMGHYEGTYNKTGKAMKADFIHRYQFRNSKIIHFKQYTDTLLVANARNVS